MSFVKIGDTYFNPRRIDYIEPLAIGGCPYEPYVRVCVGGKQLAFNAHDFDIDLSELETKAEALGVADAMVAKVVSMVNEALK